MRLGRGVAEASCDFAQGFRLCLLGCARARRPPVNRRCRFLSHKGSSCSTCNRHEPWSHKTHAKFRTVLREQHSVVSKKIPSRALPAMEALSARAATRFKSEQSDAVTAVELCKSWTPASRVTTFVRTCFIAVLFSQEALSGPPGHQAGCGGLVGTRGARPNDCSLLSSSRLRSCRARSAAPAQA
jgi:hypothetical protein